jgi:hypothetical protein
MTKPLLLRRPIIQKVAQTVSRGVPLKHAALVAGITTNQLSRWMKNGAKMRAIVAEEGHFPSGSTQEDWMSAELHQEVEIAHAKVVERYAKRINTAAKKSWQAAAWWLQRREKESFSTQPEKEDAEKGGGPDKEQFVFHCPENGRG